MLLLSMKPFNKLTQTGGQTYVLGGLRLQKRLKLRNIWAKPQSSLAELSYKKDSNKTAAHPSTRASLKMDEFGSQEQVNLIGTM